MTQACKHCSEKSILISHVQYHISGLVQDCSISIANALEIQSFTKPLICDNDAGSQGINKNNIIFV